MWDIEGNIIYKANIDTNYKMNALFGDKGGGAHYLTRYNSGPILHYSYYS